MNLFFIRGPVLPFLLLGLHKSYCLANLLNVLYDTFQYMAASRILCVAPMLCCISRFFKFIEGRPIGFEPILYDILTHSYIIFLLCQSDSPHIRSQYTVYILTQDIICISYQ